MGLIKPIKFGKSGQVSMEILILISVLVICAVIVAIYFFNSSSKAKESTSKTYEGVGDVVTNFNSDYNGYVSGDSNSTWSGSGGS